ncbi:hypothetical protein VP01_65g11 [Puccinia sorghi]|uniref:DUF7872 domain-containing protein n=1 Tax=Puccinia sorghi TaxID=27349 RepID=A0A0L6UHC1_9BASI|nr:hypothetical protein VP01_65g11 [Puccinia sorghi]
MPVSIVIPMILAGDPRQCVHVAFVFGLVYGSNPTALLGHGAVGERFIRLARSGDAHYSGGRQTFDRNKWVGPRACVKPVAFFHQGLKLTSGEDPRLLCKPRALEQSLWSELGMNFYLYTYPNGTVLSLEVREFPIRDAGWCARFSMRNRQSVQCRSGTQDFEFVFEGCVKMYMVETGMRWWQHKIGTTLSTCFIKLVVMREWSYDRPLHPLITHILPTMVSHIPSFLVDLEKDPSRTPRHITAWVSLASNWISSFPSSLFISLGPIAGTIWSWGQLSWLGLVMILFQLGAFGWVETLISSSISWLLGQAQHIVQGIISNVTQEVIHAGISTPKGLASLNQDGIFLSETPVVDRENVQKEYQRVLKLKTLVKVWREQDILLHYLIKCYYQECVHYPRRCELIKAANPRTLVRKKVPMGRSTTRTDFRIAGMIRCSMMSIVRGDRKGDGFDPTIYRASLVEAKYGFTTEFLTTTSWECQRKYGAFEFDPHLCRNMTSAHNLKMQVECSVNLPVCDCTRTDVRAALQQGVSITKACREINGLPI